MGWNRVVIIWPLPLQLRLMQRHSQPPIFCHCEKYFWKIILLQTSCKMSIWNKCHIFVEMIAIQKVISIISPLEFKRMLNFFQGKCFILINSPEICGWRNDIQNCIIVYQKLTTPEMTFWTVMKISCFSLHRHSVGLDLNQN